MNNKKHRFSTLAIHAGQSPEPVTGAIMPPIFQNSTYAQSEPGKPFGDHEYSRSSNPTRTALESNLAALEQGQYGLAFASGCAALACVLQNLEAGGEIVLGDDVYGGTLRLFKQVFNKSNLSFKQIDMSDEEALSACLNKNTQLVCFETPTNPLLKIVDIKKVKSLCVKLAPDACIAVDNTFATPYLQNPLTLGADIVLHSTTKYIGGHSDVVGGALIVNDEKLHQQLQFYQNAIGAVPSPMDCFLLLRSTKTLAVRMQAHCQNAKTLVKYFSQNPLVESVLYPGLENHPGHSTAVSQMRGFGGMIGVNLKANLAQSKRFLTELQLFTLAESLGGVESLVEHPAIMTHATIPEQQRNLLGIGDNLIRFSVGIEDANDLINDLDNAFKAVHI